MHTLCLTLAIWLLNVPCIQCFEKRAFTQSPQPRSLFDYWTEQVCGYVTADINLPIACATNQYCNTISGFFGCCNSLVSTPVPTTSSFIYTYIVSITASYTSTSTRIDTWMLSSYRYEDCAVYTTCLDSWSASKCGAVCTDNTQNLVCSESRWPYCQDLTMAYESPNATFSAFWCAESRSGPLPIYASASQYPIRIDETTTTTITSTSTTSSDSTTEFVMTSVTQSSLPAAAASTITLAATPTASSGASPQYLPPVACAVLVLLLSVFFWSF